MSAVIIVGGGPAGAAMAIALRNLDVACIVMDEGKEPVFKPGESLAPNAGPALQQLQIGHLVQGGEHHIEYTGNTVAWGDAEARTRHFFSEPYGNGWHLDRLLFEKQLRTRAVEKGADWLTGWRFSGVDDTGEGLIVSCVDNEGETVNTKAAFVVDCTGRASGVARRLGVKKQVLDNLTAYCFLLDKPAKPLSGISFIESVKDGWWYAAPLSKGRVVVNFMSDSDLHTVRAAELPQWLFEKIQHTQYLRGMLELNNAAQLAGIHIKTASTSFLQQPAGLNWLAVGDALCTYDPLTSFGITIALAGSYHAAFAIKEYMQGKPDAIPAYINMQQDTFNKSMAMLQQQYQMEQRWNKEAFWQRRH